MKKIIATVLLATFFICLGFDALYQETRNNSKIYIQTMNKPISFFVEKAVTQKEREQGLANRHSLDKDSGMLFVFKHPQVVRMWMKDTYIPLDMIFINNNKVVSIHKNAKPMDETIISSKVFASAVLEVNAGTVNEHNIRVGDKIRF
ncbi:MAG: DUF192 domain-containing protein [Alphaproteobacteria bacterium]|nr:DUF192 domain-containing protein [Alphaproteobacteria bacterium]